MDLYVPDGTPVYAIESGVVVTVKPFTGPKANSPWWNDTSCVMIKGESGVINYGEISPNLTKGNEVKLGYLIGYVKQVLKKDKGKPMSMLHLELYLDDTVESVEWNVNSDKPDGLMDPTDLLKGLKM